MSKKLTIEDFIKRSNIIHNFKYDYSKFIYVNCIIKGIIICKEHGEFLQNSDSHLHKRGCPTCGGSVKHNLEDFIKKAQLIHDDKYNYSLVNYINDCTKIIIICKEHGKFFQSPNGHLSGNGCKICGRKLSADKRNLGKEKFIERANKIHKNKYNYEKVNYINSGINVSITCKTHGEFLQSPNKHLIGNGCHKCYYEKISIRQTLSTEEFIFLANKKHNNIYDYSLVNYVNSSTKIIIFCKKHGKFSQTPNKHLMGSGCAKCSSNISKLETMWLNSLNISNDSRNKTLTVNNKRFKPDAFDPITNTIYEFYGNYWHGNPRKYNPNDINLSNKKSFGELYQKTIEKENILRNAGYNVISIWEDEYVP